MINLELSKIFYQMAEFLDVEETTFRSRAYAKAARVLEYMEDDVEGIYKEGGVKALEEISGVGKSIALKIEEYIKTGKIKQYQKMKKECPVDLDALMSVEGLGLKKIKVLYKKLGVKNLKTLGKAARSGEISKLDNFGKKSEQNILQAIEFAKAQKGRFLLGVALPISRKILAGLKDLSEVDKACLAGSIRRRKETVGDFDILVTSDKPEKVMDFFVSMPEVSKVWSKGPTRSSVRLKEGLDCDLRVVDEDCYGSAQQYFTGSKEHNIATRRIALKRGLKLNEYGVFRGDKKIVGKTEHEVYQAIGLRYIEPEMRTNNGEIVAALENKLPHLISYKAIKGDCHCHTDWSDGTNSIMEMAQGAKERGLQYIVIADHGRTISLREKDVIKQMKEIDRVNRKLPGIKVLKGIEVDIKADGSLLLKDEILSKLDVVIASVHSGFKMSKTEMTDRLVRVMKNPHVDIIGHPTGRLLLKRKPYEVDFDRLFKAARQSGVALEINAHASRLDLKDIYIKKAVEEGVLLTIGCDAHNVKDFDYMELGIAMARRGWASKQNILNSRKLDRFLEFFKS